MLNGLLKSKFQTKCKSLIKMTKTRLEMIKKKRGAMQKYLKIDIADLLQNGLDPNAYSRAEGFLREINISSCYEFVDLACSCIAPHISAMSKNRECPEDCREAVASLMFAAARFADLPELRELRNLFTERYGKSVESYANEEFVAKLKSVPHSKDEKLQLLQDIAHESGIEWNSKALEQKLYKPPAVEEIVSKNTSAADRNKQNNQRANLGVREQDICSDKKDEVTKDDDKIMKSKRTPSNRFQPKKMDQNVQQDPVRSSSRDEVDGDKSISSYSSIPPPYTRQPVSKTDPILDVPPNGSDAGGEGSRKLDVQRDKKSTPEPRSVRRRPVKLVNPPPGQEYIGSFKGDETMKKNSDRRKQKDANQNGRDLSDEEERKIDELLMHYSNKNATPEPNKEEPKSRRREFGFQSRAASLPLEVTSQVETKRGHIRATSYETDMNANGHIHPKLPDYDDFVARLAAFRGEAN
ncbi:Ist1 domain-containing protein [Heracleum sosnowskyi]|uniref:Ist1 domain-containing protein n=1 Tax=Heracleum sosnowskyi TaxID=360622 RepID=A0AAD8I040_9APIA|nr:Ist1 domain-containing protein [Heracleum sosnowskyi]